MKESEHWGEGCGSRCIIHFSEFSKMRVPVCKMGMVKIYITCTLIKKIQIIEFKSKTYLLKSVCVYVRVCQFKKKDSQNAADFTYVYKFTPISH